MREDPYAMFLALNAEALKSLIERHCRQAYFLGDDVWGGRDVVEEKVLRAYSASGVTSFTFSMFQNTSAKYLIFLFL